MSDLAVTADTAYVLPQSGELINLNDAPVVAGHLRELRDLESKIREAKGILTEALAAEAQRQGKKTLYLDTGKVEITGGPESYLQWDLDILEELLKAGLPEERWNDLVTVEVSYKVDAAVAKQIEGAGNSDYALIVGRARRRADRPWAARLSR